MLSRYIHKKGVSGRVRAADVGRPDKKIVGWLPPATRLKNMRNRIVDPPMTALECAKLTGVGDTPSAWLRYESALVRDMGDEHIPDRVVMGIMPHWVGRGSPPITEEELLALAKGGTLMRFTRERRKGGAPNRPALTLSDVAPTFPKTAKGVKHLTVRYRAERGSFMTREAFEKRTYGVGPIVEAPEYKAQQQLVHIADDHAEGVYPQGTVLHIIHHSAFAPDELVGRRVVLKVDSKGLISCEVGVVHQVKGNRYNFRSINGDREIEGDLLGVVHRSLHLE